MISDYLDKLQDLVVEDFFKLKHEPQMRAMTELKEYLKVFVKEREHLYKIKIE